MSAAAFPELGGEVGSEMIREFLDIYEHELGRNSVLFDGVAELLDAIEAAGSRWGIVTNKPEYLAKQVLPQLGWDTRSAILIGGDTLPPVSYTHRGVYKRQGLAAGTPCSTICCRITKTN